MVTTRPEVLLVEDDAAIREALTEVLEDLGYGVFAASDGERALELAAGRGAPCPVVLDWRMPNVDGARFLERLRALPRGPEFPVIVSTGDRAAARGTESAGVVGVLTKPFELNALLGLLARAGAPPP